MTTKTRTTPKPPRKAVKENTRKKPGLARLIESEMEKAEVVMAAKAILDKLQDMAEEAAKLEAEELMRLEDPMRTAFGPQVAERFSRVTGEKLRSIVNSVKAAKDAIGGETARLEGTVNGDVANDMAMEPPPPAEDDLDLDASPEDQDDDLDAGMDELSPDEGDENPDEEIDLDLPSDDELGNAAGRPKKESARPRGRMIEGRRARRMLRESNNPDALVFTVFRRKLAETRSAMKATKYTARLFDIDRSDVTAIVREGHAVKNKWQHLEALGYEVACDGPNSYYWFKRRMGDSPFYAESQEGTSTTREGAWLDLEAYIASQASGATAVGATTPAPTVVPSEPEVPVEPETFEPPVSGEAPVSTFGMPPEHDAFDDPAFYEGAMNGSKKRGKAKSAKTKKRGC